MVRLSLNSSITGSRRQLSEVAVPDAKMSGRIWLIAPALALHAAGFEPKALDQSGRSVTVARYAAVLFNGVLSALRGCFLSIGDIHTFTEGMTSGAG